MKKRLLCPIVLLTKELADQILTFTLESDYTLIMIQVLTNRLPFILFISLTFTSCSESYVCEREDRTALISWNSSCVFINHMDFCTRQNKTLNADSPDGASHIQITPDKIVANYIQATRRVRLERPSGEIIPNDFGKKLWQDIRTRGYARTYVAVVPTIVSYTFKRKDKTLVLHLKKLTPPRMEKSKSRYSQIIPIEEEVRYNPASNSSRKKLVKILSRDEAIRIFPSSSSAYPFSKCKKRGMLMAALGHMIETLLFP